MKQRVFWEAKSRSASKKVPRFLWNEKTYLPLSQEPATGPYLEPDNPLHILTPYSFKIHFNIIIPTPPRLPD